MNLEVFCVKQNPIFGLIQLTRVLYHMFAISPVATTPTALSLPPSVLAAPASDLVSTRQTSVAVSAPLTNSSLNNDSHATVPVTTAASSAPAPAAQNTDSTVSSDNTVTGNSSSSAFLTQLLSQTTEDTQDNQIALATSFAHFSPAPTYNTLIGYSIVKYRPSDAGLPSAYAAPASETAADESSSQTSQTLPTPSEYSAYSNTTSRNQTNLTSATSNFSVAG